MRLHNFAYLFKEGGRNIFSNKLMSFACIGVLVACMLLIGGAALFSLNVNSIVSYIEEQNEVFVYLEKGVSEQDIAVVHLALKDLDNIFGIRFISKEEALENEREKMGEFAGLLDGLEETNPLPDTFVLQVDELSRLEETVGEIRDIQGVEKVNAPTDFAVILTGLKRVVTVAGISVVSILVVVSVVIITNTIKLTVFSRRKEINIMKYVGATDTFIRMPFLVEGMLIGVIAAVLAFLALGFGYSYLIQWMGETFTQYITVVYENAVNFWDIAHYIFGAFTALGVFIGVTGSGMFVRKYLKV